MKNNIRFNILKTISLILRICIILFILFLLYCVVIYALAFKGNVYYSFTNSLKKGYFLKTKDQTLNVGDIVVFKNPDISKSLHHTPYLLKQISKIEDDNVYVKGKSEDELFKEYGIKNLKSYDSDIFGYIKKDECIKVKELKLFNKILRMVKIIYE